jgi:gas vesicle protein
MSDNDNTGAFLTGFLIGGLVGAAAALLMTPQSGEKTRLQLQERGIELKTQFEGLTADARGQAEKLAAEIQERGKVIIEERLQGREMTAGMSSDDKEPATDREATETPTDEGDDAAA